MGTCGISIINHLSSWLDKDKDREQRRQLEVKDALKKREEWRLSSMVQIQPLELHDLEGNPEEEQ